MPDPTDKLELDSVETGSQPTQRLIDGYAAELAARRLQLEDDLSVYRSKLRDLGQLDPLDFTGLGKLYRAHVAHIEVLLQEFDGVGATP
jgi:hypothetical protein